MIPDLPFHRPIAKCLHKQLSDFVTFKSDEVPLGVTLVELGTKIQNMNLWIVAFQNDKIFLAQESVVFLNDIFLQCSFRNSYVVNGRANDGPHLQQNKPVPLVDVIGVDWDVMVWHCCSEDAHYSSSVIIRPCTCVCMPGTRLGGFSIPDSGHHILPIFT